MRLVASSPDPAESGTTSDAPSLGLLARKQKIACLDAHSTNRTVFVWAQLVDSAQQSLDIMSPNSATLRSPACRLFRNGAFQAVGQDVKDNNLHM